MKSKLVRVCLGTIFSLEFWFIYNNNCMPNNLILNDQIHKDQLVREMTGATATLILNRPEKSNALTMQMIEGLIAEIDLVSSDSAIRCLVIRGAGTKAFCAGADLGEMQTIMRSEDKTKTFIKLAGELFRKIQNCPQPVIAAVDGVCIGGGLFLACSTDLKFCSRTSKFAVTAGKLKITLDKLFLDLLTATVGRTTTAELILAGKEFDADEAQASGLINRVFAEHDFNDAISMIAEQICDIPAAVQQTHKKLIRQFNYRGFLND